MAFFVNKMLKILKTALPLPAKQLFYYSFITDKTDDELIGCRALLSLGKRNITGIITGICNDEREIAELKEIKPIIELLDEKPVFTDDLLELTRWMSEYYLCSWGEALRAAFPQPMSPKSVVKIKILQVPTPEQLDAMSHTAPKRAALLKTLMNHKKSVTIGFLEKELKTQTITLQLNELESAGFIEIENSMTNDFKEKPLKALIVHPNIINPVTLQNNLKSENIEVLSSYEKIIKQICSDIGKKAPKQALLLSQVYINQKNSGEPTLIADIIKELGATNQIVNALLKKEYLQLILIEKQFVKKHQTLLSKKNEIELKLTDEQDICVQSINEQIEQEQYKTFMLFGITGSGKTLVYLHTIRQALKLGKSAIFLVPEISLTPQLIDRFRAVFGDAIAVLHSKISIPEKLSEWSKISSGRAKIVIGARSALFAPLKNLGLIIVDEEHESSYKQDSPAPRYNARDAAIIRARFCNAVVVLGSATPSFESMHNAHSGRFKLLEILNRADGATMPEIEVVDMVEARKNNQLFGAFTKKLLDEIIIRLKKKEGIILLQNRRGFANLLECPDCGTVPTCKNCSITLTYHKNKKQLRCHYCGYTIYTKKSCPECGHPEMVELGFGTQRVEEQLLELLEGYGLKPVIDRMDLDTTNQKDAHRNILHRFASGETDILIGTQMVAKGLDFKRVTLVGVINADLQLLLPDFRSTEKTFQLLTQVSGRAGRSSEYPGKVLIQTSQANNPSIISVLNADYHKFYSEEIQLRKLALYPPFSRFVVIEFSGLDESLVAKKAAEFHNIIPRKLTEFIIFAPIQPTIPLLRKMFRRIIIIKDLRAKDPTGRKLQELLNYTTEIYSDKFASQKVKVRIDIDSFKMI